MPRLWPALLLGAAAFAAAPARAEIKLEGVRWEAGEGLPATRKFREVEALPLRNGVLKARVRAKVAVRNASPVSVEGILLRYCVSALLAPGRPRAVGSTEGSWTVPFLVEEKRIPRIGAQRTIETSVDPTVSVRLYVARMARAGYRVEELRLAIMVEPRPEVAKGSPGEQGDIQTIESIVKVKP
ncbi:MAG: hypothetical protein HY748_15005 [Elusimicrobia bacterium]|nr:hypothetical protein [Elusimicrobiota bacterium]